MPRVRMLQSVAGERFSWRAGEIVEMSAADAKVWADGYRGELVRGEQAETPERSQAAPETAARPRPGRRKTS
ncbi:hypothetical protein ETD86_34820 [Nonomuraea turkmeniaca]|uniref:Uncharacterized protein n=1 Tax=Nonomuraea turkmeniaca TaxID=103838 RepID=A0A5S4F6F9_9ACTN|nr:hypothetical protein [Nonomuraea turkmeniaca]TMR11744.1 hypothetical protein ETD86_34820 [Nonomuraea turkmeniaca]